MTRWEGVKIYKKRTVDVLYEWSLMLLAPSIGDRLLGLSDGSASFLSKLLFLFS